MESMHLADSFMPVDSEPCRRVTPRVDFYYCGRLCLSAGKGRAIT